MSRLKMKALTLTTATLLASAFPVLVGRCETTPGLALTGARLHQVSGPAMDDAVLLIRDGLIEALGEDLEIPPGYDVIRLSAGSEIYPAMIDADSNMGRIEIGSVRGTVDVSEVGKVHPDVRAEIAINADSEHIHVTRSNGVLLSLTVPRGGIISGTSALIKLDGWNWEEMLIKAPVAMHVHWPRMKIDEGSRRERYDKEKKSKEEQRKARDENLKALKDAFKDARAYWKGRKSKARPGVRHEVNPAWEAMGPVLEGRIPVVVHASGIRQLKAALEWSLEEKISIVFAGGGDVWMVADELSDRGIPVILQGIQAMPRRDYEPYDTPFATAFKLHAAGVRFCIANGGGAPNARNLPYLAAMAAAFGLPKAEALKSITLYPAQILGVDDRYGSIAQGKEATFIVTDGDILDIRTHVTKAYISGRGIDLSDRHKNLYKRYRSRGENGN